MPVVNSAESIVATWNTAWAPSVGQHPPLVRERLAETAADIFVVTEGHRGLLPIGGYVVDAGDDWGYDDKPCHRKMLLHSPCRSATSIGSPRVGELGGW